MEGDIERGPRIAYVGFSVDVCKCDLAFLTPTPSELKPLRVKILCTKASAGTTRLIKRRLRFYGQPIKGAAPASLCWRVELLHKKHAGLSAKHARAVGFANAQNKALISIGPRIAFGKWITDIVFGTRDRFELPFEPDRFAKNSSTMQSPNVFHLSSKYSDNEPMR